MKIEIAITKSYLMALAKLPKATQKKANEFFEKFKSNPDSSSINYESLIAMNDDKVRTVRIDQKYRAIVLHPPEGNVYLFVYIDNHDEAMDWAKNKVFDINENTAAVQLVDLSIGNQPLKHIAEKHKVSDEALKSIAEKYSEDELASIGIPRIIFPVLKMIKTDRDLNHYVREYVSADIYDILEFCLEGISIEEIKEYFFVESTPIKATMYDAIMKDINKSKKNHEPVTKLKSYSIISLSGLILFFAIILFPKTTFKE